MSAGEGAVGKVDWGDLRPRVLSAIVMLVIGGVEVWLGGAPFALFVVALTGGMMWELARMTADPGRDLSLWLGSLAAGMLAVNLWSPSPWMLVGVVVPAVAGVMIQRTKRKMFFGYALVIMAMGLCLVMLRESLGLAPVLWVFGVVIVSDVMGYFAGRIMGVRSFGLPSAPRKHGPARWRVGWVPWPWAMAFGRQGMGRGIFCGRRPLWPLPVRWGMSPKVPSSGAPGSRTVPV